MKKNFGAQNSGTMWIYGIHAFEAVLRNPKRRILKIMLTKDCGVSVDDVIANRKLSAKVEIVDKNVFASLFGNNVVHQGCAVLTNDLREYNLDDLTEDESDNRPFVFLDHIQDPQNIGSILRSAAVFGARAVVVTDKNSPKMSPAIAKTASGAVETVPLVRVVNMIQALNFLKDKGFWSIGLDERAEKHLSEIPMQNGKFVLIVGSEENGIRRLTRETCDFLAKLPIFGDFSTLNAAQAATVSLYEILRQQRDMCGVEKGQGQGLSVR